MKTETTTLTTQATYSDDGEKRYLLKKTWDEKKPKMAIVMLHPSIADGIQLDTTTQLVINNASRLGYGSVAIVNLSAVLNDFNLSRSEEEDPENTNVIVDMAKSAESVIYAPGTGKSKSKTFLHLQKRVLLALKDYESKLCCLCNEDGDGRLQHPLSPQVRTWSLSPLKISELITIPKETEQKPKKKAKAKEPKESQEETPA